MTETEQTGYMVRLVSEADSFSDVASGKQTPAPEGKFISSWHATRTAGLIGTGAQDITYANGFSNQPRTWKTREAAQKVVERFTTDYRTFEVVPVEEN